MDQLPGFTDKSYPDHVCKLHNAIYRLHHAPRAWYIELRTLLLLLVCSQSDASLFILRGTDSVVVLLYVGDIILTGSSKSKLYHDYDALARHFSIKDLSPLIYFLGVEVCCQSIGLYLSQKKYILIFSSVST